MPIWLGSLATCTAAAAAVPSKTLKFDALSLHVFPSPSSLPSRAGLGEVEARPRVDAGTRVEGCDLPVAIRLSTGSVPSASRLRDRLLSSRAFETWLERDGLSCANRSSSSVPPSTPSRFKLMSFPTFSNNASCTCHDHRTWSRTRSIHMHGGHIHDAIIVDPPSRAGHHSPLAAARSQHATPAAYGEAGRFARSGRRRARPQRGR